MTVTLNGFRRDDDGFIIGTTEGVDPSDVWVGGLRFRAADAAVRCSIALPDQVVNGWPTMADGALCVEPGGVTVNYQNGIPFSTAGRIPTVATGTIDHWQNSLPFVGEQLAMLDQAAVIHPIAFDSGFSNGFF